MCCCGSQTLQAISGTRHVHILDLGAPCRAPACGSSSTGSCRPLKLDCTSGTSHVHICLLPAPCYAPACGACNTACCHPQKFDAPCCTGRVHTDRLTAGSMSCCCLSSTCDLRISLNSCCLLHPCGDVLDGVACHVNGTVPLGTRQCSNQVSATHRYLGKRNSPGIP
jgi:hypothetical protein